MLWVISCTRTCDRWSRTWRQTTWLPSRRLWLNMRAFSKDSPPITYLSDCLSIHSSIWNNTHRKDLNLRVFLEYEEELGVRGKNVKEKISEFFGIVQVCNHKSQNVSCDPREVLPFRWRWGSCCLPVPSMMVMPTLKQKRWLLGLDNKIRFWSQTKYE